jgi:hypothetical protein
MRFSRLLKPLGFKRNRWTHKSDEFEGFWEGDFGPVFKNTEKWPHIGSARLSQLPPVAGLKSEFGRPGNQQIGVTG